MNETKSWQCPECETLNDAESTQCAVCGLPRPSADSFTLPPVAIAATYTPPAAPTSKKARRRGGFWFVLLLLLCVSGVAVFLYLENESLEQTILLKEERIDSLEESLSKYKKDLSTANASLSDWKSAAEAMDGKIPGYGDNYFRVDKGVVVLKKGGSVKLALTTSMSGSKTIDCSPSNSSAYVTFDQNNWYSSTTLTVHGQSAGICLLTFSASNYSKTFKVLVYVK